MMVFDIDSRGHLAHIAPLFVLFVLQVSNVFAGKHGFITPRDLFRWADRGAVGYQELAENGLFILGERLRNQDELSIVKEVLERNMKVKVSRDVMQKNPLAGAVGFEQHL